ncbi:hypothetical protein R8Z50_21715 [Longispora sp. K20-0274]|uniref:hypothetical protein n=1 Tax=Longispora sp. K20-0274 TaxID=3088255 RepID=UPI00399A168E
MTWHSSPDVPTFLAAAGDFLGRHPVEHTVLLTEAAYLTARPDPTPFQRYGWWRAPDGEVAGAYVQAPRHPPILSPLPPAAIDSLPAELTNPSTNPDADPDANADGDPDPDTGPGVPAIGVDGDQVDAVISAWRRHTGTTLVERSRITLYRLERLTAPTPQPGTARTALPADRPVLVTWFERMMAAFPDDPSDLAYVVDDPLDFGGITLWEVDGEPVAMAGRSRTVAGMTRLSAVYAPADAAHADAAFAAACAAAARVARDVVVFAGATDGPVRARYHALGFRPVLDRVMLGH